MSLKTSFVGLFLLLPFHPLDHSSVISEDLDMGPLWDGRGKGEGEE